jgi:co-chaperonin GroES (HSP10)
MKIVPRGERILVRLEKVEEVTEGGIILTKSTRDRDQVSALRGTVVALGPDAYCDYKTPWCKEGDTIVMTRYSGENINDEESEDIYRVINDTDVMGVIING